MLKVTQHKTLVSGPTEPPITYAFDIHRLVNSSGDKTFEVSMDPETFKVHLEVFMEGETFLFIWDGALSAQVGSWLLEVGCVANYLEKSGMTEQAVDPGVDE